MPPRINTTAATVIAKVGFMLREDSEEELYRESPANYIPNYSLKNLLLLNCCMTLFTITNEITVYTSICKQIPINLQLIYS